MEQTEPGASGPFFDELTVGQVFDGAPSVTLTPGHAAVHQSLVGDRLRLALDHHLAARVTGQAAVAHPALVWDVAIGQSTLVTQRVIANLFYRGLRFRRAPLVGDTLHTTTRVEALRGNRPQQGRHPTGMAALRIVTSDQDGVPVLDFWRCAMLPLSRPDATTDHADDLDRIGVAASTDGGAYVGDQWRLDAFRRAAPGQHFDTSLAGRRWRIAGGDVVSAAPELARLTVNIAMAHHDSTASAGRRLVYGGHTIGLALSQATRCLPNLVTVVAWHGCDHTGPVYESDTVHSELEVERAEPRPSGGGLLHLRSRVTARRDGSEEPRPVLDWRFIALMA
jgi:acyl dehydratase